MVGAARCYGRGQEKCVWMSVPHLRAEGLNGQRYSDACFLAYCGWRGTLGTDN